MDDNDDNKGESSTSMLPDEASTASAMTEQHGREAAEQEQDGLDLQPPEVDGPGASMHTRTQSDIPGGSDGLANYNLAKKVKPCGSDSLEQKAGKQVQEPAVPPSENLEVGLSGSERVRNDVDGLHYDAATRGNDDGTCRGTGSTSTPHGRTATTSKVEQQRRQTMQEDDYIFLPPSLADQNEDLPQSIKQLVRGVFKWLELQLHDFHYHVQRVSGGGISTSERQWQLRRHAYLHWQLDEYCSDLVSMGPAFELRALASTGATALNWILWSDTASSDLPLFDTSDASIPSGRGASDQRTDKQIQESAVPVSDYRATYLGNGLWVSKRVHHNGDRLDKEEANTCSDGDGDFMAKVTTSTPLQQKTTTSTIEQKGQQRVDERDDPLCPPQLVDSNQIETPTAQLIHNLVKWLVRQLRFLQDPRPATGRSTPSDRQWQLHRHAFLHGQLEESLTSARTECRANLLALSGAMAVNWILWFELASGDLPLINS